MSRTTLSRRLVALQSLLLLLATNVSAQATVDTPGQPSRTGVPGGFEIVGESFVSAMMIFLGTEDKVLFVDKVENNPTQINNHPAWASEWAVGTGEQRAMDIVTNSFCAGGNVLGNGTWLNVGGNLGVTFASMPHEDQTGQSGPYFNADGRTAIRMLDPCDDSTCEWSTSPVPTSERWYPTLETLQDGSIIILGGSIDGGFVNNIERDNPTYQFFPPRPNGDDPNPNIRAAILADTLPANLYPLTWLLPDGRLLVQSNWATAILNYETNEEERLDDIPDAVRVYPASAASILLPLRAKDGYKATILFCGGTNAQTERWGSGDFIPVTFDASPSCVKITPLESRSYEPEDPLPQARVMVNMIYLPTGKILTINGASKGTAGYGNDTWALGHSYADEPQYTPLIYDPDAPAGSKFTSEGLSASEVARMYHSVAVLLPDGSVMVSGSNPNPDVIREGPYPTEYRTEIWYPTWYRERRPQPRGLLAQLSYGGPSFDITLDSEDLFGDVENVKSVQVNVVRPGFSTHNMNMGQRFLELETSYTAYAANKSATIHVAQMPPNAALFPPGPALVFVVVDGVPSVGKMIMVGSGQIGEQPVAQAARLTAATVVPAEGGNGSNNGSNNGGNNGNGGNKGNGAGRLGMGVGVLVGAVGLLFGALW
ncbi:copper radical oxidase [Coprinopsis marcescibilis]|uniref:Copper radical oxidase n=1 Tax=Coprinopsis marcescibilis TaxID=230819 RepID=A0A5C3L0A7_COPMA|nr:copper radical oxidase [Coprinopsis marcescibilis]